MPTGVPCFLESWTSFVRDPFGISLTFESREEIEGNVGDVARAWAFRKDDRKPVASFAREPFGVSRFCISRGEVEGNVEEGARTWGVRKYDWKPGVFFLTGVPCFSESWTSFVREPFGISLTFDCREEVEGNVGDAARAWEVREDD